MEKRMWGMGVLLVYPSLKQEGGMGTRNDEMSLDHRTVSFSGTPE